MSQHPIYLALYKGRRDGSGWRVWVARFTDGLTRILTRGRYSHCEIAVRLPETADGQEYECYSASIRDGGVRLKTMPLPADKWDLIALPDNMGGRLATLWAQTQGQGYDLPGAFGVVFGLPEKGRTETSASAKPKPFRRCRLLFLFLCPKSSLHSV